VTYPLRRLYGDSFTVAPLAVLVDPVRARRVFGLEGGGTFSAKVAYIFRKQLEEADVIVISKSDLLTAEELEELSGLLQREFPAARVLSAALRNGRGLEPLVELLLSGEQSRRSPMAVDYEVYADGEALLGWLNATVSLRHEDEFDANSFLRGFAAAVQQRLAESGAEIAHFKMTFSPDGSLAGELASVNLVRSDYIPELGMELDEPVPGGQLIVNLRAEADPEELLAALRSGLDEIAGDFAGLKAAVEHAEHFRPGKPVPTHRDASA
jgi:hypothetical protein